MPNVLVKRHVLDMYACQNVKLWTRLLDWKDQVVRDIRAIPRLCVYPPSHRTKRSALLMRNAIATLNALGPFLYAIRLDGHTEDTSVLDLG
jgi:hypothetical protein